MRRYKLSLAAVAMLSLDDAQMRLELGMPAPVFVARGTGVYVFDLTAEQAAKLAGEYRDRCGPGWDFDNRGAATQTCRGPLRELAPDRGEAT